MTTHYMAQLDGVTFTRSTANRAYTHMVVGFVNIAKARAHVEKAASKSHAEHIAYNTKEAAGKTIHIEWANDRRRLTMFMDAPIDEAKVEAARQEHLAQHEAAVVQAQAKLDGDLGCAVWVAGALAEFDNRRAKATNVSSDGLYYLCDCGWASRLDLAEKNAATHTKHAGYGYEKVEVLEAVQVAKAAKPSKSKATR